MKSKNFKKIKRRKQREKGIVLRLKGLGDVKNSRIQENPNYRRWGETSG